MSFHQFPVRFGKYIVLDRISAGGMAEVYRAKEVREDGFAPIIALKRMLPSSGADETMTPMFVDEAKLASQLVHPNIAQTYELGRVDDDLYIAMEMVWGRDLRTLAKAVSKTKQPFPVALACYAIAKSAEALDFAHNAKAADGRPMRLVHRDVSPHNLMLSNAGDVKVIDFGVAKADSKTNETVAGVIKGKFSYMAPEQVLGTAIDARTDIFALGIVLYELITGERLYDGSSAFSIFDKVVNHPAPLLADSGVSVPPGLSEVVAKCLAKKLEDRYQNAGELADALAPFLIQNRTIFGPRDAATFLRTLFPDDENEMRERMQRYTAVREADCVDSREALMEGAAPSTGGGMTEILAAASPDMMPPAKMDSGAKPRASDAPTGWMEPRDATSAQPTGFMDVRTAHDIRVRATAAMDTPPARQALPPAETSRRSRAPAIAIGLLAAGLVTFGVVYVAMLPKPVPPPPPPEVARVEPPPPPVKPEIIVTPEPEPTPQPQVGTVTEEPPPVVVTPPPTKAKTTPVKAKEKDKDNDKDAGGFGFVTVGAKGSESAKVYIDGKEIGFAPVIGVKLKAGKHDLKIVPINDELPGTPHTASFTVGKENTQANPVRVSHRFP